MTTSVHAPDTTILLFPIATVFLPFCLLVPSQLNLLLINAVCLTRFFGSVFHSKSYSFSIPSSNCPPTLSSLSCSEEDVRLLITSLPSKTSSGPDNISSQMLKGTIDSVSPQLVALFNQSLSSGCIPSDWKISNVTPIFKAGDPKLVSNYRPISLLSLPSKLLERFIHNSLLDYILSNSLLSSNQFGFRPGSSTQEALLTATTDWHSFLDSHSDVAAVFFDLSKAFDSIPHEGILDSLRHVGVHGPLLKWFSSYLSDRQQRVVLDGQRSPLIKISSGVPQGSILGPLLFIIYMDHISNVTLSPKTRIILYADDILLYAPITAKFSLQSDIDAISSWISSAGLSLNLSKTKFLVLSRKRCPPSLSLRVAGSSIVQVTSFKYLGVTISSNLSWRSHINNVCSKAKRQVGFLYRNFGRADSSSLLQLYKSLVLPILDYCSSVWDPHLLTDIKSLESVQSFATKIITKSWQSSAESRISSLNLQTLFNRRRRQKVQLCFRILSDHSIVPSSFFTPHPHPNLRHTNSRPLYYGPSVKSKSHLSSFKFSCVPIWNCLPPHCVLATSSCSFKKAISPIPL